MSYFDYSDGFAVNNPVPSTPIFENRPRSVKVTLAIPTYKRTATLRYAIMSALSQDYDDYEIIVLDNNPERGDETESFMQAYKDNKKMSYYKNAENIGLFGNWNRCFELANGEWVTLLHDDDYYFPNYLSTMFKCLSVYPYVQGLYCNRRLWYDGKEPEPIDHISQTHERTYGMTRVKDYMLFISHPIGPVGIFLKKENVIKMGGYNPDCYPVSDYSFNWRYHMLYGIYYIDTILVHYRIGINVSIRPETIKQQEEKNLEMRREFLERNALPKWWDGITKTTYNNNLAIAQKQHPGYDWGNRFSFKRNFYYVLRACLLFWHNHVCRRFSAKALPR